MTMREWFQNLMIGRYGGDALGVALLVLFLLLAMTGQITNVMLIRWLSLVPALWGLFRMLSRNSVKRSAENRAFLAVKESVISWGDRIKRHREEGRYYRFYRCPGCRQKLRVPRGRGKIEITCPKCGRKIIKKT